MGGQACVLYGAAEFSKDFDFILLIEEQNLVRFQNFLVEIDAKVIAIPSFEVDYLKRGHAVHFRSNSGPLCNLRIDIMANLRGVDSFTELWTRRSTAEILPGVVVELLSLSDLVQAKKTQRDKDWPMIRRLVDVDYLNNRNNPTPKQITFWLRELRSPEFLVECVRRFETIAKDIISQREKVLNGALSTSIDATQAALDVEQSEIRNLDRAYWLPLRRELEELRKKRRET